MNDKNKPNRSREEREEKRHGEEPRRDKTPQKNPARKGVTNQPQRRGR
jgi:hypothetical protein